jgi:hypothetical protein
MDLRRLRAGEWIVAVSGVALMVSLFLPWYGRESGTAPGELAGLTAYAPVPTASESLSGWGAFAAIDAVLALIAASAVGLFVVTATQRVAAVPIALDALVALAGFAAMALVFVRVLALPGDAAGREWGLWLGLASAAGIAAGGMLAMRDERLSPPGRTTDATGKPVPAPREIEALPPPEAAPR